MVRVVGLVLTNFFLAMLFLAILLAIIHNICSKNSHINKPETFLRYLFLLVVGVGGIYGFIMHSFFADFTAHFIGWAPSPFQFEVAVANLGLGVAGLIAFTASRGFQAATLVNLTCFLWGAAAGHMRQMLQAHDVALGNVGSVLYTDIFVPLLMIILFMMSRRHLASDSMSRVFWRH